MNSAIASQLHKGDEVLHQGDSFIVLANHPERGVVEAFDACTHTYRTLAYNQIA